MVSPERHRQLIELGSQEWQRRRAIQELRDERRRREPRLEPPAVPARLLYPGQWPDPESHLEAIRAWIGDDPLLLSDAADSVQEMAKICQLAASGHGTGDQDIARSDLRVTLRQARNDSPRFDSLDHAIDTARPRCKEWSVDQYRWHFGNFSGQLLPVALHLLADDLSDATLARLIFPTWKLASRPEKFVGRSHWRVLFHRAGFTRDGKPAAPPTGGPRAMYRAADHEHRFNFSWTSKYWLAAMYAGMRRARYAEMPAIARDIRIWRMDVPPENLLAHGNSGGEHEWVVDTSQAGNLGRSLPIRMIEEPEASEGTT